MDEKCSPLPFPQQTAGVLGTREALERKIPEAGGDIRIGALAFSPKVPEILRQTLAAAGNVFPAQRPSFRGTTRLESIDMSLQRKGLKHLGNIANLFLNGDTRIIYQGFTGKQVAPTFEFRVDSRGR
jgi:hypothetical protein